MNIKLKDGAELHPIHVIGGSKFINGASRDTLNFIFPADTSLDELDGLFTAENCEKISLFEDNADGSVTEHIYTGYTIRAELSRTPMVVQPATEDTEEVTENRVTVSMTLRTYAEKKLDEIAKQVALQEDCIVELACEMYA